MKTMLRRPPADIVMLGTFGVWTRGTLQSRALPLARSISATTDLRVAIVTTPWDDPDAAGATETIDKVRVFNTTRTRPSEAPLAILEQSRLLRQLRPRLIHVMKPKGFGGLTAQLRASLPGRMALVVDFDDWEGDGGWNDAGSYDPLSRRLFAFQEKRLIQRADQVTAASTLLEERARKIRHRHSVNRDGVTFLPNGLEPEWLRRLADAGQTGTSADSPPGVLLYSRFAEFSMEWLRAFLSQLDTTIEAPVSLHVIGDLDPNVITGASFEHVTIRHLGYLERDRLPAALAAATVALFPYEDNLINRSKQSVKLLELMASGRPVVACDVGDIARIGGDAIELSPSPDPQAVAGSVVRLLRDRSRQRELGEKARKRAARYTIDQHTRTLLTVYRCAGLRC